MCARCRRGRALEARVGGRGHRRPGGARRASGRVRRARRRRDDPKGASAVRRHERAGVRDQLRDGRVSRRRGPRRRARGALPRLRRRLRGHVPAGARRRRGAPGPQRCLVSSPAARPGRRAHLQPRRPGRRPRALRRAGRGHACRLDGLQPREQRPDPRLGRGGLRRLLHRAPHADRPAAGGRAG